MSTINCIVVDDEPLAQRVVEKFAEDIPWLNLVCKCNNALEAMEVLSNQKIDLMFLDINMPKITGMNFLKSLKNPPLVIITTAYPEYALEGYELDVLDYLKKPFAFERFVKAVQKAQERLHKHVAEPQVQIVQEKQSTSSADNFIFVKSNKKTYKVGISDIYFIEALGDYVKINLVDKIIITYQSMKKIESLLPPSTFFRIHKSFIVSIPKIKAIEGNMVEIKDEKLPIGNNYKQQFLDFIEKYSVS